MILLALIIPYHSSPLRARAWQPICLARFLPQIEVKISQLMVDVCSARRITQTFIFLYIVLNCRYKLLTIQNLYDDRSHTLPKNFFPPPRELKLRHIPSFNFNTNVYWLEK